MSPVARRTDPATSHLAAQSLGDLSGLQRTILEIYVAHGSLTDERLIDLYLSESTRPAGPSTIRTRRRELQNAGWVTPSGTGKTRGGRSCQIFSLAQAIPPR